jgi:superfamily II RNA helicase
MAGRAGRRGIDTEGTCVIALDARDGVEDVIRVVDGSPEPILSQFRLGYGSVALLVGSGAPPEALRRRVEASFGQYQNLKRLRELEAEVARVERALAEARGFPAPCGDLGHMERYRRLRQAAAERHARARGERGLWDVEPGRLLLLRQRGRPTLAMAVRVHTLRGRRALVDALLPHGALARVKGSAVKQVLWATPPLVVGQDRASDVRALRPLAAQLAALDVSELLARERARESASALGAVPCHRCPWTSTARCEQASREIERLAERVTLRRRTLDALRGAYWQEFLRVVEVLEQFGAIREGRLEPKGRLIAALRHDNELLVAEVVGRGLLDDLSLPEAAALCSTLSEDARSGEPRIARAFLRGRPRLRRRLEQVVAVAEAVAEAQRERRLTLPVSVHPGYMPAVYRWAAGDDDWPAIVADAFGGHEGDLIRAMRRLIDLLRQLAESGEVAPATARLLGQAARALDRGIVLESALI